MLVLGDGVAQRVLVAGVGAFGALQAGQGGVGFGFVHQQRVAGGEGFDFAVGQGGVADVADLAGVEAAADDLADEPGLAFEGLPGVAVEAGLGHVPVDLDLGVEVALAQDAAFALGDVGGPPGGVEVVQGDGPVLHVGADAHLLGGADQDGDAAVAAGGEQLGLVPVGLGFVDEPDRVAGHAAGGELAAELVVDVPAVAGGAEVAEHQLQGAAGRVGGAVGAEVFVVAMLSPDGGDPVRGRLGLAGGVLGEAGEPQVQGCPASVAGDFEHVVFFRADRPVADFLGAVSQVGDVVEQVGGGFDGDGLRGPLPVVAAGDRRDGQGQVVGGLDVGGDVQHAQHLGDVAEAGEPAFHPEAVAALGGQLDLGDDLAEGGGPGVEHLDPRGLQQVRAQVALHHVRLGDRVGDRGGGGERDHPGAVAAPQVADLHVQVGGPHRPVDRGVGDVGGGAQVLIPVRLVDAQVVDAGGLEGDAGVLGRVELGLEPFLGPQQRVLAAA